MDLILKLLRFFKGTLMYLFCEIREQPPCLLFYNYICFKKNSCHSIVNECTYLVDLYKCTDTVLHFGVRTPMVINQ